jgi:hypothetical protein
MTEQISHGVGGPARSGYREASNRPEGRVHDGARNIGRLAFERLPEEHNEPQEEAGDPIASKQPWRTSTGRRLEALAATLKGKQDELNECRNLRSGKRGGGR